MSIPSHKDASSGHRSIHGCRYFVGGCLLLCAVLAASVVLHWLRSERQQAAKQAIAEESLDALRPTIYHHESSWIRRRLGLPPTASDVSLDLPATDADLRYLGDLITLRSLVVHGPKVTDASLVAIGQIHGLEELLLESTDITDAGLESLTELHNLTFLKVTDTRVTVAGATRLKKSLKNVNIVWGEDKERIRFEATMDKMSQAMKRVAEDRKDGDRDRDAIDKIGKPQ